MYVLREPGLTLCSIRIPHSESRRGYVRTWLDDLAIPWVSIGRDWGNRAMVPLYEHAIYGEGEVFWG